MGKRASEVRISKDMVEELRSLSASDADRVVTFVQHLVENPYDQKLIGSANAKGDLFLSGVTDKLFVYWAFDKKRQPPTLMMQPAINVLGLARKRPHHGLVPLFSIAGEGLPSA